MVQDDPAQPGGPARHAHRVDSLHSALLAADNTVERAAVEQLMRAEWARYNQVHRDEQRTLSNLERVAWMTHQLGCPPLSAAAMAALDATLEESLFAGPPRLVPGMAELVRSLAERCTLAIISDTSYSTGKTLRRLLDAHELLPLFDSMVFSDELGCAKPALEPFEETRRRVGLPDARAVHIGDREATDVLGAKRAGFDAVLFLGALPGGRRHEDVSTRADHTARSVDELTELLLGGD